MEKYTIENEKLCLNGKPAALEFGNRDQIAVIREYEEKNRAMQEEGLEINPTYEIQFKFNCICGYRLSYDQEVDDRDDISDFEPHGTCTCHKCNRYYSFELNKYNDYVVMLLGFKPKTDD